MRGAALSSKLDDIETKVNLKNINAEKIVYGVVDMNRKIIRKWQYKNIKGEWVLKSVRKKADVLIPENLEKMLTVKKKYKVIYGGRGGTKSVTISNLLVASMNDFGDDVMCFREVQKSLKSSVFKGMSKQIKECGLEGFRLVPSQGEIRHTNGAEASFWGLSGNLDDIKGLTGYKRFWTDEAEKTSEESLTTMGPTLRGIPGAELWFSLNPKSRMSPIAQQFLVPFERELTRDGYYEDDHYLIIKVGHETNPWFDLDETLVQEIEKDKNLVKIGAKSQEWFDHVWNGAYNDDVENALIKGDWLNACIDAHEVLGFGAEGIEIVAHDPSDEGPDSKGLAYRHGSIIKDVKEKLDGDVNTGSDWALGYAIANNVDRYTWDVGGMGITLKRDVSKTLSGKKISVSMFNGGEGVDMPNAIYEPTDNDEFSKQKTNKEVFRNKRSQMYTRLRNRCYNTYMAIKHNRRIIDTADLISFSSEIDCWEQLRAELCKLPLVDNNNGTIQIMSKKDMIKPPLSIPSPNLADSVMMTMDVSAVAKEVEAVIMPTTNKW